MAGPNEPPEQELSADLQRSIFVTEPGGARQIFVYDVDCQNISINGGTPVPWMPSTYGDMATVPGAMFDNTEVFRRNSFYWNRQQSALVPAALSSFTPAHYKLARLRHWLGGNYSNPADVDALSIEQAPSPDGVVDGQKTWYDHAGKTVPYLKGTQIMPSTVAQKLPDNSVAYVQFARNPQGYATTVTETYGTGSSPPTRTWTYVYSGTGGTDLSEMRGPGNELLASFTYNYNHQLLTARQYVDATTFYQTTITRDAVTRLPVTIARPTGLTTTFTYLNNRVSQLSETISQLTGPALTRTRSFTWNSRGHLTSYTDPRGLVRNLNWDSLGYLLSINYPADNSSIAVSYIRPSDGKRIFRPTSITDRLGKITRFDYNGLGQRISMQDAMVPPRTTTYSYCGCGGLESITNPLNEVTRFTYDYNGNLTQVTRAHGTADARSVNYKYNLLDQLIEIRDHGNSIVRSYAYNNQGLIASVSNPSGQLVSVAYDIKDRPATINYQNGPSIAQSFDYLNRLTSRTVTGAGAESFAYSARGLVTYTDRPTPTTPRNTTYAYDEARRLIQVTNPKSELTKFFYNPAGDLLSLVDGANHTVSWVYDNEGRMTRKDDPAGRVANYAYDRNHRVTSRTDALNVVTTYTYDNVGNLLTIVYPNSPDVSFGYDGLNRITSMTYDADNKVSTFSYIPYGTLLTESGPWPSSTVSYGYTLNRQRQSLTLAQPSGGNWAQNYAYDASLRLQTISSSSQAGQFTYGYLGPTRQVASVDLPNGARIEQTYDSLGRFKNTRLKNSALATVNYHDYEYDDVHRRTRQNRAAPSYVDYTYDAADQLATVRGWEGGTQRRHENLTFTYDAAGNLATRANDALNESFTVNAQNALAGVTASGTVTVSGMTAGGASSVTVNGTSVAPYASDKSFAVPGQALAGSYTATATGNGQTAVHTVNAPLAASITFTHDAKGNLTGDGQRVLAYDDENQLIRVEVPGQWKTEFGYDGLGRRRWKKEFNGSGTLLGETRYVYDGRLALQERDGNNTVLATYTRGLDLSGSRQGAGGIGGLLARADASGPAYYHADGAGNVTALMNGSQQIVARYLYDPFGNLLGQSGPLADANPYRFSSKEHHAPSGLYYYGYRYYVPNFHRWLNRDPIEELADVNLFRFNYNSPPNYIDTEGRIPQFVIGGAIGFGFGVGGQLLRHGLDWRSYDLYDIGASTLTGVIGWGLVGNVAKIRGAFGSIPYIEKSILIFPTRYLKDEARKTVGRQVKQAITRCVAGGAVLSTGSYVDYPVEDALDDLSEWAAGRWRDHLE